MQNELMEQAPGAMDRSLRRDDLTLLAIAAGMAVTHIATNGRYGFHRDELQTLRTELLRINPYGRVCPICICSR
jgi:hypothetical protein